MKNLSDFKVGTKYRNIYNKRSYTCVWFTRQGTPVLVDDTEEYSFVVQNPDRFEKIKLEKWVNVYWDGKRKNYPHLSTIYDSQIEATDAIRGLGRFYIKTIQLDG